MRNILNTVTTGFRSLRGSIGRGDSGSGSGSWGLGMKLPNLMLGSTGPKDGSGGKFNWLRCATTQLNKPRNLQLASICARTSNQAGKGDEFILHDEKASFFFSDLDEAQSWRLLDVDDIRFLHANKHEIKKMARVKPSQKILSTQDRGVIWESSLRRDWSEVGSHLWTGAVKNLLDQDFASMKPDGFDWNELL